MTTPGLALRRPDLRRWSNLRAMGGTLVDFVPPADVVGLALPDAVDLTGTGTLTLDLRSRVVASLAPLQVLEVVNADGTVEEWRMLGSDLAGANDRGAVTVTLVPPIVYDWTAPGVLRAQASGGLASFDLSGLYTPSQALALALAHLAANGHGHWTAGTIDRTDAKPLTIQRVTPLALLHAITEAWGLEPEPVRVSASSWTIGLRDKVGAGAAVPVVRASRALASVRWKRDATPLATAVHAVGAADAGVAHAAWTVTGVAGAAVSLQDPAGDGGPIQIDGQLVGAYLQKADGTRTAITATSVGDRVTSVVTVASASGVSAGQLLEFRADNAGTRLVALEDTAALAGGAFRREVALERTDLDDVRNYVVNPRGATISGGQPVGWVVGGAAGPVTSSLTRVTTPAAAAGTIGDDGTGQAWQWAGSYGSGFNASWLRLPATPTLDGAAGDSTFLASVWLIATAVGGGVVARLVHSADPAYATPLASTTLPSLAVNTAVRVDLPPFTLASAGDLVLELQPAPGTTLQAVVLAGQVARGTAFRAWAETPQGNVLWQAANAHLLRYRTPEDSFDASVIDLAALDPAAFGDVPLVKGGDVQFQHPEIGLVDQRARILSILRDRWNGTPPAVTLTAAPDPVLAALLGRAAPTRKRTLVDMLTALSAQRGGGS